jgi:predicted O-methyltransferase YrrM
MLQALADTDGEVVSIDRPDGPYNAVGTSLLEAAAERMTLASHRLIEDDSVNAIPRLFQAGEVFDLIFVDGWKTFDHLAAEIYYLSRMLKVGGVMVFDDAAMPSVNKAIQMLLAYYRYLEIDYKRYGQTRRLRTFHILTTKSIRRPYRGFLKGQAEASLAATQDWNYFARF